MKPGNIGPRLLLMTNRKLHTRFRLVAKSMTMYDHEWPLRTPLHKTCLSAPTTKIWMNIHCVPKKTTLMLHTIDSTRINRFR